MKRLANSVPLPSFAYVKAPSSFYPVSTMRRETMAKTFKEVACVACIAGGQGCDKCNAPEFGEAVADILLGAGAGDATSPKDKNGD